MPDRARLDDLLERWEQARENGTSLSPEELCQDTPELLEPLRKRIQAVAAAQDVLDATVAPTTASEDEPGGATPAAEGSEESPAITQDFVDNGEQPDVTRLLDGTRGHGPEEESRRESDTKPTAEPQSGRPQRIGRYRILRVLGKGGFGQVLLAYDAELDRQVAIKIPRQDRIRDSDEIATYLEEARTVAGLDHPGIVPVYDVGRTDEGHPFVVSKFIEGSDLASRLKEDRPRVREAVNVLCSLSEALHYAHTQGLVHRDIKPGNILLDQQGQAYLCDFGLALRDEQYGQGPTLAGTPAYMSPEQARGEGHRVDGRSDIYSLGVVLYELLTGRRPFEGDTLELLRRVAHDEPKPPRQIDRAIAAELERVTLKCLAKRASDRYTTAKDLADDLLAFLAGKSEAQQGEVKIVPKGLRSFDAADSDFFVELLPGPRDRHGLPDSINFWKQRLEERDPDQTFGVGLLYGPSGCGKSSLMKAGLLPRLADNIRPVYLEATANETESRLLAGLRKACPELPKDISLKDSVALLRLGPGTRASRKVVLIIDQFEQWLHARNEYAGTELADALRQCDGGNVQAVLMVRDDFWMAVSRLFRGLDIPLVERQNSAPVDLFDLLHARKMLAEFGRAYGRLPDNLGQLTGEQERFLDDAITGLATDGKVTSVRLALFSEIVKGKPWTPETLNELGGISGVGVSFLEETLSARTPAHRHQQAARAVLRELLPDEGTNIKGHWRSQRQLLDVSGYKHHEQDFQVLLRILDTELRLITPIDLVPQEAAADGPLEETMIGYQLTHDFLVKPMREWLRVNELATLRGYANSLLKDRHSLWNISRRYRNLPNQFEFFVIAGFSDRRTWTKERARMMRAAYLRFLPCMIAVAVFVASIVLFNTGRIPASKLFAGFHLLAAFIALMVMLNTASSLLYFFAFVLGHTVTKPLSWIRGLKKSLFAARFK